MPKKESENLDPDSQIYKIRHSSAHLLAHAVKDLYPEAKFAIGPPVDDGFYYDIEFPEDIDINEEDFPELEEKISELIEKDLKFKKTERTIDEALNWAKENDEPYKEELIEDLAEEGEEKVTFYTVGNFEDLCEGPHVDSTSEIGAVKLMSMAGAYWRGDESNKMLTRIYGTAFSTEEELEKHLEQIEEAKKRDHRKLGKRLDLFTLKEYGPGFPFWLPKGTTLFNQLKDYLRQKLDDYDYKEIQTPTILNNELWKQSGHWDNYRENMYFVEIDERDFAVKPMNCPGSVLIFKNETRSYRDLPLKLTEFGKVHRHELSGVLHGLFRVRAFTQDDGHIFCTPGQIESQIEETIEFIEEIYEDFEFDYYVELSTRPEKSIGSDEIWEKSQEIMKEALEDKNIDYQINEGDGAFYGPKIDFQMQDSLGRDWQLGTIQLDFSMPEKLDATYVTEKGEKEHPVMIHRAALGSIERFIGILIEHFGGELPVWLAPIQARILTVSQEISDYAKEVKNKLEDWDVRIEVDDSDNTLSKKIREGEKQKIPYLLIVGSDEADDGTISVRSRDEGDLGNLTPEKFTEKIISQQNS